MPEKNGNDMVSNSETSECILKSYVNSYKYLIDDANFLYEQASSSDTFHCTQFCRSAVLLYILALEGLINRALDHFVPTNLHSFILEHEKRFSLTDKWELLPLLASESQFDKSNYPWSHFVELSHIRNDLVHPKHDRAVFYRIKAPRVLDQLRYKELPEGLTYQDRQEKQKQVKESDLVYRQTRVSKDPYSLRPEDVKKVRKTVFDIVNELDRLLDGRIKDKDWHLRDEMTSIYPPGADISDILGA